MEYAKGADPWISGLILGAVGIVDSSFFSLPEGNDILLVAFTYLKPNWMIWFVFVSAIGSLIGSLLLFSMGRKGGHSIIRGRFSSARSEKVKDWFQKYDIWAILIPCIMPPPMPFKLFVIMAGILRFSYFRFTVALFFGRIIRYSIWGILTVLFREQVQSFMQKHLLVVGLGFIVLALLLGVSFWVYTRFFKHRYLQADQSEDNDARGDQADSSLTLPD